jgi:hypothetical protein
MKQGALSKLPFKTRAKRRVTPAMIPSALHLSISVQVPINTQLTWSKPMGVELEMLKCSLGKLSSNIDAEIN